MIDAKEVAATVEARLRAKGFDVSCTHCQTEHTVGVGLDGNPGRAWGHRINGYDTPESLADGFVAAIEFGLKEAV